MHGEGRPTVGLDFGTSTTLVAQPDGVVPIGDSANWIPSLVGYTDDGRIVAGDATRDVPPEQVFRSIKRAITDLRDAVRVDLPTGVGDVRADDLMVEALREAAHRSRTLGLDLAGGATVHIGCPAMWDGRQRRRLLAVATRAGLPVTLANMVDEPVAAGIAWLASHAVDRAAPLRVLVFDMGGGTLDIAVLDVRGGTHHEVSVLAALGVSEAGDALDSAIAADLDLALAEIGVDVDSLARPDRAREQLLDAARTAKIALTYETEHRVVLSRRLFGVNEFRYPRARLDEVFGPQLDRAEQYVMAALRAAQLTGSTPRSAHDIARTPVPTLVAGVDVVLLSGGMSQIPCVRQRLRDLFPTSTVDFAARSPENAVALGLALAGRYGRVNMYRPAFDILLEWDRGAQSRPVYEAFTPLVESWQIMRGGTDLRFVRTGRDLSLPRQGTGRLRVVSHSGSPVRATLGGDRLDGFPVALGEPAFEFSIHPDGRIRMTDGGGTHEGRVQDWHTHGRVT